MQHFFVDASQVSEETIRIEGSDVNHMKNVLRIPPILKVLKFMIIPPFS